MRPRTSASLPELSCELTPTDDSKNSLASAILYLCGNTSSCFNPGQQTSPQQTVPFADRCPIPAEILQPEDLEVLARSPSPSTSKLAVADNKSSAPSLLLDRTRCPVTDCVEQACAKLVREGGGVLDGCLFRQSVPVSL